MTDYAESTSLTLTVRLADSTADQPTRPSPDDKEIKVLQRTRVSHLLKTISPAFGGYIEKDFDAYLLHKDMDIALDTACRLSDYQCKNQDVIELRRKEQPITLAVNIYADELREYQVNSSLPVYEIVKFLGKMLGVENTKELSLALPSSSEKIGVSISSLNWLDVTRSLNSQGIEDGDMVLLRKKFFIFNEDIREAEQNRLLRKIIYHQLRVELVHAKAEKKSETASAANLSQSSSGSDQESTNEEAMIESPGFFSSVIQAFDASESARGDFSIESKKESSIESQSEPSSESSKKSSNESSNESLQKTLTKHQSHFAEMFSVTLSDGNNSAYLCFQSRYILLSKEREVSDATNVIKKWSVEELEGWEKIEKGLTLRFRDEWHTLFSDQHLQIGDYLSHMKSVIGEPESPVHKPFQINTDVAGGENSVSSTPASSPMKKKTPSITISMISTHSSSDSIVSIQEEAGIGILDSSETTAGAMAQDTDVSSPSHKPKRERTSNITPPSYFGKGYRELVDQYILVHVNVLDQEIRQILVNSTDPVRLIIRDICATFDIQYPDEHYLRVPRTVEEIITSYGGKPKISSSGVFGKHHTNKQPNIVLDSDLTLLDQIDWDLKPYVFILKRVGKDEVDAAEKYSLETGQEWPDGEDPGIARYRLFYQSWMGIVQGDYPVTKKTAVKLAGLLTYVYHGSKANAPFWPPYGFNVRSFLPEKYHNSFGIEGDVLKVHHLQEKGGITLNEAIDAVIHLSKEIPSLCGLYFQIKVPSSGTLRKRMEIRTLGLRREGLVCFGKGLKQVCWNQKYTDISDWAIASASFHLKFNDDVDDLFVYSYQARQIMELMQTYVKMQYKLAQEKKGSTYDISDV